MALATGVSYWRYLAYKLISTYKETRPRKYTKAKNNVNLFLKFFVTVKKVKRTYSCTF